MAYRLRRILKWVLATIALLVVTVLSGLVPLDLSFARERIANAVLDSTGVALDLQGAILLRLGPSPQISTGRVTLKNPDASGLELARMDSLQAGLRLLPLLSSNVHLRNITVTNTRLDICGTWPQKNIGQTDKETNNTSPDRQPQSSGPVFSFDSLDVKSMEIHCSDEERGLPALPINLELHASAAPKKPLELKLGGSWDQGELSLQAVGGSLLDLLSDPESFPLELELEFPGSRLSVTGHLSRPVTNPRLTSSIQMEIQDPQKLSGLLDIHLPALPALQASTRLEWSQNDLKLNAVNGSLGSDGFTGMAGVSWASERPRYDLLIEAPRVDLSVFPANNRTASRDEKAAPVNDTPSMENFDLAPLFAQIARFDIFAQVEIGKLHGVALPIEDIHLDLKLQDSMLSLETGISRISDIPVQAQAQLDLTSACPELSIQLKLSGFKTAGIANQLDKSWPLSLQLNRGSFDYSSCGADVQAHRNSFKTSAQLDGLRYSMNGLEQPLLLEQVNFSIASQQAGKLSLNGILHEQAFSAGFELAPLFDIFSGKAWPVKAYLSTQEGRLDLDGQAVIAGKNSSLEAKVNLIVPRIGPAFSWAGINPDSTLSLEAGSKFTLSSSAVELDQLKVQLGKSDLTGTIGYSNTGGSIAVRAVLRSDMLDLQQIGNLRQTLSSNTAASESGTAVKQQQSRLAGIPPGSLLNSVDLDLKVAQIHSENLDMSEIVLNAGIHQGLIENAGMTMNLEGIPLRGELDADFRSRPWSAAYKFGAKEVDIAHLLDQLELAQVSDMKAGSIDAQASARGSDLVSMVENTELDIVVTNFHWTAEDESGVTQHNFELEHLALNLGPEHVSTWETRGLYNGAKIRALVQTPTVPATFDKTIPLPLTLIAESGADIFKVSAKIERSSDDRLKADIVVSGQHMESSPDDLSDLPESLEDYELQTSITLQPGQIHLAGIQARIGSSHLSGDMLLKDEAGKRVVTLDLQGARVETDDFVNLAQQWRELDHTDVADNDGAASKEALPNEGLFKVLNQEIDAISESRAFNIRIDVNDLYSSGEPLGEAHLGLKIDDHFFTLNPMTITLPGGVVEADYTAIEENGVANSSLNVHIDKLEYSGLLRLFSPETKDAGTIYLDTSVQAEAADFAGLAATLHGYLDFAVFPEDIGAEVLDLWVSNLVLALLPISLGEKAPKKVNCLVARMEIENGIMKPKVAFIDTTDVIVHGRGTIDLAQRNLDLLVAPQAKMEKFFSISALIAVTGPFDDFRIGIAPGGWTTTMFRWFYGAIYVPYKWLTGERFPADGLETCHKAMNWEVP